MNIHATLGNELQRRELIYLLCLGCQYIPLKCSYFPIIYTTLIHFSSTEKKYKRLKKYLLYIDLNDYKINLHNFITLYILKETKTQNPKQTNKSNQTTNP